MVAHTVLYWLAAQGADNGTIGGVPWNEALSNIAGSASIVCWFIVFTPQFWINYKRQSGESLSLVFLYIWLAGDIMNLVGAIMEDLLLTMRVLAWYYTVADIALIAQVFYYRKTSIKATFEEAVITHPEILQQHPPPYNAIDERTALLAPGAPSSSGGYTTVAIPPTSVQPPDPQHHIHDNEHDQAIHDAAMKAKMTTHQYHHATLTTPLPEPVSSPRERRPSSASAFTSSSAYYRAKMLKRRRRVRKAFIILLPIIATLFFIWAYHDWLQCTIEGGGGDDQDSERCGRGQNGGHGKLPPPRTPSSPDYEDDGVFAMLTKSYHHRSNTLDDSAPPTDGGGFYEDTLPLLLGWGSAILYLGSRIPQIYKNWRLKSCEGLSIMMFMFSVFGNVFYVASIFLYSVEWDYLLKNMPWWLGSGGTLVFDFTIFFQFYKYRHNHPLEEALKDAMAAGELDADDILPEDDDEGDDIDRHHHRVEEHRVLKKQHHNQDLEVGLGAHPVKKSSASTSSTSTLGVAQQQQQQHHPVVAATAKAKEVAPADISEAAGGSSRATHVEPVIATPEIVVVEEVADRSLPAPTPAPAPPSQPAPTQPSRTEMPSPKPVEEQQQPSKPEEPSTPAPPVTVVKVPESPSTPPTPAEATPSAPEAPSPSSPSKSKNKKKKKKSNKKK